MGVTPIPDFDAIIIGAGLSGLYQLYRLREQGLRVRVFEAGTDVGGTWYWNRYPGARFDSESYSYGYSFSKELLQEWDWSEHFAGQPETLRYINYVADKFDLRHDIQFRSRLTTAVYDEETRSWTTTLEDGSRFNSRFLITAIGPLSTPTLPPWASVSRRWAVVIRLLPELGDRSVRGGSPAVTFEQIIERVRGCPAFPMTPAQVDEALHQELWDGPSGDNPGRIIL